MDLEFFIEKFIALRVECSSTLNRNWSYKVYYVNKIRQIKAHFIIRAEVYFLGNTEKKNSIAGINVV